MAECQLLCANCHKLKTHYEQGDDATDALVAS
jgi:5-methylcytosine-specific restriction endonuclease McrA